MQPLPDVAKPFGQLGLHEHMYVLGRGVYFHGAVFNTFLYLFKCADYGKAVFFGNNALRAQHKSVGDAAADIFGIHSAVHGYRTVEIIGIAAEFF